MTRIEFTAIVCNYAPKDIADMLWESGSGIKDELLDMSEEEIREFFTRPNIQWAIKEKERIEKLLREEDGEKS